jgi:hypothetical protein
MSGMNLEGTRRVLETTSHETANQYLRFGWNLINQYVVEATEDQPATVKYVLASVRRLEDTRRIVTLTEIQEVNEYLGMGWKLIDRHVTTKDSDDRRHETMHFVLAWQSEDPPPQPGAAPTVNRELNADLAEVDDDI